jgi:EmrB/QacA subfamily drug resistance transporter
METQQQDNKGYEWVALSVTTVGALLASIQGSALIIGLPDILASLNAEFLTIIWVLLGYMLITTAVVPIIGRLADIFGRKKLYNAGFAIFTIGSLLAGLSQGQFHGWDLVVFRAIQGIGGALLFANSTAIVTDAFRRGRVGLGLGINQIATAAGFVLGPVIGGLLAAISWRWIFLVNVPLGILGTFWGIWRLREPVKLPAGQHFDVKSSLAFLIGISTLLMALSMIGFPSGSPVTIYVLLGVAVVSLAIFLYLELHLPQPVIDPALFKDRLLVFANLANTLNGLARGAVLFLLTFFLQGPYGKDPLTAGIMMAPYGVAFMLVGPISGILSDRYGSRGLSTVGLIVSALGLFGLATVTADTPYWTLVIFMVLMGGGSGLFGSPNTNAIMSSVTPERRGIAAATRTMLGNTGQMLSVAIAFPMALSHIPNQVMSHIFLYGGGMQNNPQVLTEFEQGLHSAFLLSFGVTLIAAIASYLRPSHSPQREVSEISASQPDRGRRTLEMDENDPPK